MQPLRWTLKLLAPLVVAVPRGNHLLAGAPHGREEGQDTNPGPRQQRSRNGGANQQQQQQQQHAQPPRANGNGNGGNYGGYGGGYGNGGNNGMFGRGNRNNRFNRNVDEDRILSAFAGGIGATLRSNYFQTVDGCPKHYISIKLDPAKLPEVPLPRPAYEVFVYAPEVEGVHLRNDGRCAALAERHFGVGAGGEHSVMAMLTLVSPP